MDASLAASSPGKWGGLYPIENSALPARLRSTACWMWYSQTSLMRLSHQLPQGLPSRLVALHIPKSFEYPMTTVDSNDSGVMAKIFSLG